ncbi:hypothetical protein HS99_0006400 [Kitasatospora aureofaciens]|uniref:Uncharacterized protein n=1 Tax=Kitasatospora aureofaciens TaxID=1894 RepID=A0A1E7N9P0_KITAU|nr:hypothetical protein B6264_29900 [Kitasatospora aureofaciens]OEV37402.1 hypothetical protein HS99_0006400 [Kitasatospora aureofaciens]
MCPANRTDPALVQGLADEQGGVVGGVAGERAGGALESTRKVPATRTAQPFTRPAPCSIQPSARPSLRT